MLDPTELFPQVPNLYEFLSVHADLLYDEERVGKYSQAIAAVVKKGDTVADIGTGTGLLAFLCLQSGAKRVHAIERSASIKWAKKLAGQHGFSDRIIFHDEDSRTTQLDEKVDVVISELIGHIAFEEGMAESLLDARDRFLLPEGTIIPQSVKLIVALVCEREVYPECVECWRPITGIDYGLLRKEAVKSCYLTKLSVRDLMSEPSTFFAIDCRKDGVSSLAGSQVFKVLRPGKVNGIAMWFQALLSPGISLSSSPWDRTHWKQCFAPISPPMHVRADDRVAVEIEMKLCTHLDDHFVFRMNLGKEL